MPKPKPKPFYGVDGNLLVEDLQEDHETVENVLNDTFWIYDWPTDGYTRLRVLQYPQFRDEREKRRHRKTYRAKLEAKRSALKPW